MRHLGLLFFITICFLQVHAQCTMTLSVSSTDESALGSNDGTATVTVSGGTSPYTYLWNDSIAQTTAMAELLSGGETYVVTVTDAAGCVDTASVLISTATGCTIAVTIQAYPDSVLPGVYSLNASVTWGQTPYTYLWSNGETGASIYNITSGSYSVTVTDMNGCQASDGPVNPFGTCGVFFFSYEDSAIAGMVYFSTLLITGQSPFTYAWVFSDGGTSTEANPVYSYTQGLGWDWATLTIMDSNGCTSSYTDYVQISLPNSSFCQASFSAQFVDSNGVPGEVFFYDGSYGPSNIVSWAWAFGDGDNSSLQNPIHTYTVAGNYAICLTITDANGCMHSFCQTSYINPAWWTNSPNPPMPGTCGASFIALQDSTTLGLIYLVDLSYGNDLYYTWDFGNGTIVNTQYPFVSFTNYGLFNICLTITDTVTGCMDTYCDTVNVDSSGTLIGKSGNWGLSVIPTPQPASSVTAVRETKSTIVQVSIYPNPIIEDLDIEIILEKRENVYLEIVDLTGKTIESVNINLNKGVNNHRIDLRDLVDGVYFIHIRSNQVNYFEKVIKLH